MFWLILFALSSNLTWSLIAWYLAKARDHYEQRAKELTRERAALLKQMDWIDYRLSSLEKGRDERE